VNPEIGRALKDGLPLENEGRVKTGIRSKPKRLPDHPLSGDPDKHGPSQFPELGEPGEHFQVLPYSLGETETGIEYPLSDSGIFRPAAEIPEIILDILHDI
jgi:hypothetical protein